MKKVIFALILFFMADKMAAQESQTAYNFLRLPVSAHAAALGGDNVTLINDDAWLMFNNPALLSSVSDKTLALSYMNFMRGVNLAGVAYNKVIKERASAALSVNYVDYGKMRYTTADSNDSIAPSMAMVKAGRMSVAISVQLKSGSAKCGSPVGMPLYAVPIVFTPSN